MPNLMLTTVETLIVVVVPLLFLYNRSTWRLRETVPCLVTIPVLWYLTYAPIHELSHIAGTYLAGGTVGDFKLIPRFWAGEFAVAWITPLGLTHPWQNLVMSSAPYVGDVASVIAGWWVLRRRPFRNVFAVGAVFMLLCLRPAFDLVCESVGLRTGFRGDLYNMQAIVGEPAIGAFLVVALALALFSIVAVLRRYAGFPGREAADARTW